MMTVTTQAINKLVLPVTQAAVKPNKPRFVMSRDERCHEIMINQLVAYVSLKACRRRAAPIGLIDWLGRRVLPSSQAPRLIGLAASRKSQVASRKSQANCELHTAFGSTLSNATTRNHKLDMGKPSANLTLINGTSGMHRRLPSG